MKLSFRMCLSIVTVVLIVVMLWLVRAELHRAWQLLGTVNLWLLLLVIPITGVSYLASGEMIFSYLRQKKMISEISPLTLMRISLELNFVNHVLPSGGVSGVSYVNWRMGKFGISSGKSTMAQAIRYLAGFAALVVLLVISLLFLTLDGNINRWTVYMSSMLVLMMIVFTVGFVYLIYSPKRMHAFSKWFTKFINDLVYKMSFGRQGRVVEEARLLNFFDEIHEDYLAAVREKRLLARPFWWGIFFTLADIAIYYVTFLALGTSVNPAPILIGYGMASFAGFLVLTPGGTGAYEAVMVGVIVLSGIAQADAIAGVLLTRILTLLVTIGLGYVFYQLAILKYGKRSDAPV